MRTRLVVVVGAAFVAGAAFTAASGQAQKAAAASMVVYKSAT